MNAAGDVPSDHELADQLARPLRELAGFEVIGVAYSGGRDSTALLHATLASLTPTQRVIAMHVHHGLSMHADEWLAHCQHQCEAMKAQFSSAGLQFQYKRLEGAPAGGESIEAWARAGRYAALQGMAQAEGAACVLMAHHRRDQAETFLLQALRGGGLRGLSSMPRAIVRDGVTWLRPWLKVPREAIEAYLQSKHLKYVDDDSNDSDRYARNRLRLHVWPALTSAFPQAEGALEDAATWAQEAHEALAELAGIDLAAVQLADRQIDLQALSRLSAARQSNLLRTWLTRSSASSAPATLTRRLIAELHEGDAPAAWKFGGGVLRRYRQVLSFHDRAASQSVDTSPASEPVASEERLFIAGPGRYLSQRWTGELHVDAAQADGAAITLPTELRLVARTGGEQFQPALNRPARSLKKQFQAAGVPEWQRDQPLVYAGDRLAFVPGLGIDARLLASPGEPQITLEWRPTAKMSGSPGHGPDT
ncbi:tRNA lysidine(34) synthetase TilS [soil metagenome]